LHATFFKYLASFSLGSVSFSKPFDKFQSTGKIVQCSMQSGRINRSLKIVLKIKDKSVALSTVM